MVFCLVYIWEDGERQCVCFSEEFFESFSWDPPYRERFNFLIVGNGEFNVKGELGPVREFEVTGEVGLVRVLQVTGELALRVEGLLSELRELGKMKEVVEVKALGEVGGAVGVAAELEKLVLLRLLFVLEEGKAYLTAG